jgi:hypothetical protein
MLHAMIRSGWHAEWDAQMASLPARRRIDEMSVRLAPLAALGRVGISMREASANLATSVAALNRRPRGR